MVEHDAVHQRQAEAGALAHRLGGEERIEDALHLRRAHADARVDDVDARVAPGAQAPHRAVACLAHLHGARAQQYAAREPTACTALVTRFANIWCSCAASPATTSGPSVTRTSTLTPAGSAAPARLLHLVDDVIEQQRPRAAIRVG